jgi:hypothetical protein
MALHSPEDYVELGLHLVEIDVIFGQFLHSSGYSDNTGALGRYPHRSAVLRGTVSRKIDLAMDTDPAGHRFDHFFSEIPYTLWCGYWLDDQGLRYVNGGIVIFERLPFSRVKVMLGQSLEKAARLLEEVNESSVRQFGKPTKLPES